MELIFEKAVDEPAFSVAYAQETVINVVLHSPDVTLSSMLHSPDQCFIFFLKINRIQNAILLRLAT